MTDQTTHLSLPLLMPSQAQKHLTHNEALVALDALVQLSASASVAEPPTAPAPAPGERVLVAAGARGAFAGQAGRIALWDEGEWRFFAPRPGWLLWLASEARMLVHDGSGWTDAKARAADRFGIGARPDDTNRLAVSSPAVLFDHAGTDSRVTVNKAAVADTASLVFQRGYSGRAEMGLAGDDGFRIKVSADGAAWTGALAVDGATGAVGIGLSAPKAKLDVDGPIRCKSYPVAALPPAANGAGQILMVANEAGGPVLAFSDGANWRRVTDRAIVQ